MQGWPVLVECSGSGVAPGEVWPRMWPGMPQRGLKSECRRPDPWKERDGVDGGGGHLQHLIWKGQLIICSGDRTAGPGLLGGQTLELREATAEAAHVPHQGVPESQQGPIWRPGMSGLRANPSLAGTGRQGHARDAYQFTPWEPCLPESLALRSPRIAWSSGPGCLESGLSSRVHPGAPHPIYFPPRSSR